MNTIPACPPTPTLDELLNSGNFIEVNATQLEVGETVIQYEPVILDPDYQIRCVEIVINSPEDDPNDEFGFRYLSGPEVGIVRTFWRRWMRYARYFRKINHRKDFDDVVNETNELVMSSYPPDRQLSRMESLLNNPGIPERVGEYLGGPSSLKNPYKKSGGRRKTKRTRRTRKNKRKSTRRIRRKYKK